MVRVWRGSNPVGFAIPVAQDFEIARRQIVVGAHEIGMDGLGELVRDLAAGEHVEVPGEGIAGLAVETVDLVGELGAARDLAVRERRVAPRERLTRFGAHPPLAVAILVFTDCQHPVMTEGIGFSGRAAIPVAEKTHQLRTGVRRADQV